MSWRIAKCIAMVWAAILGLTALLTPSIAFGQIQQLISRLGLSQEDVGFILIDLGSGATLAERNADQLFLPASVAKLVTAYAALEILGPGYAFSTLLYRRGTSVYLKGGGDPVLTSKDLQALVLRLTARPIQEASTSGKSERLFYDESLMVSLPEIDSRQTTGASYNTGLSALDVDFNRIDVEWSPNGEGVRAFRALCPADDLVVPADWVRFSSASPSVTADMPFLYAGDGGVDRWLYSPLLPLRGSCSLPAKATTLHAALLFRALAGAAGLKLATPEPRRVPSDAMFIGRIDSPPLGKILAGLLRYSNNASAELIGLAASRKLTGRSLSLAPSAAALTAWLEESTRHFDWSGFRLENHSGLSSESRISPRQMAEVLRMSAQEEGFMQAMPALGEDDPALAINGRLRDLRAKSGTMDYARGLAGYFRGRDGRLLAFAIFAFDRAQRAVLDATQDPRILDSAPAAKAWARRAAKLDEALLQDWMANF